MGLRIELQTRHCLQHAQNFGPELLDQVLGPKIPKKVPKYAQAALGGWPGLVRGGVGEIGRAHV